jgi:hypothetical protein
MAKIATMFMWLSNFFEKALPEIAVAGWENYLMAILAQ